MKLFTFSSAAVVFSALLGGAAAQNNALEALTLNNNVSPGGNNFTTLVGAASNYAGIVATLNGTAPLTLFAPSNAAFAKLPAGALSDAAVVESVLLYHVIPGAAITPTTRAVVNTALNNTSVKLGNGKGQALVADVVGGKVVLYFGLGNATVVETITAGASVVHVIDTVLIPPRSPSATATSAGLGSLVGALTLANLASTVDGLRGITIFAPVDAAFAALMRATNQTAMPPVDTLKALLTFHVVPRIIYSTDLTAGIVTVPTVQGQNLTVNVTAGPTVQVSGLLNGLMPPVPKVIIPGGIDILIDNGVVHLIDGVLLPNITLPSPNTTTPNKTSDALTAATSGNVGVTLLFGVVIAIFSILF
ncbi:hypothetical protein HK102_004556 [Quaeritorhiza haematococci]|nr:hypothetical protein HK102_004556 [Quaeritorhiza haematococci]